MKLGIKYLLMTVFIVLLLSVSLEGISLNLFSRKIHDLTKDLFTEKLDRLTALAYQQDELYFEGVYKDIDTGRQRLIDKLGIDYRMLKDQTSYVFVIDTTGKVILHPAESRWGTTFRNKIEKGKPIFPEAAMNYMNAVRQGEYSYTWHGIKKWCVFKMYEPWGVFFCQTTSVANRDNVVMSFLLVSAGAAILVILLGMVITLWLSQRLIYPVNLVIARLHKIARGELTFSSAAKSRTTDDEIILLDQAVNKMAEDLSKVTVSRDHVDNILNAAAEGIMGLDVHGKHTFINLSATRMLGYDPDELIGQKSHDLWHHTKADGTQCTEPECSIYAALTNGTVYKRNDEIFWRKDGTSFPVEYACTPLLKNGVITGAVVTFNDITDRKQAEAALSASESQWQSLVKEAPARIIMLSQEGRILFVNHQERIGYNKYQTGQLALDTLDIIERSQFSDALKKVFTTARSSSYQSRHKLADGSEHWCDNHLGPVRSEQGIKAAIWITFDITERILAEDNNRKLSQAVAQSSASIIITDRSGAIEYCNPAFSNTSGYRLDEVFGQNIRILKSGEHPDDFYRAMWEKLLFGQCWTGEIRNRKKDGGLFWESVHISPVLNSDNKITHFVAIIEDISERKEMEANLRANETKLIGALEEVKKYNQQLEQAQDQLIQQEKLAAIGFLAAGVAHEINNPLGYVQGNLTALQDYTNTLLKMNSFLTPFSEAAVAGDLNKAADIRAEVAKAREELELDYITADIGKLLVETNNGLDRIKNIVQGLKSFSRSDTGKMQTANVNAILDGIVNIVWNEIKYHADLVKDYAVLPLVECNPQQLGQVFLNLLVNAAQSMPVKGVITLRTFLRNAAVVVEVRDTGTGIPDDIKNKIFDPFFTTKEPGKGTGLGLSISYDIIKKHGGFIDLQSKAGEGTVFSVVLPHTRAQSPKAKV
ncbi:MAG: PAS domain S-box protein [Candidatus Omnitrophica bacterium]|nr:PAS domain S-box protein [Candidatus Omnitrophota bacterium]